MIGAETLRIAWGGIIANKLRSGLTILGMTIGVAAVIILIAVGNGSSKAIEERIESLGTNVLLVESGATRGGARFGGASSSAVSLTRQDAAALQNRSEAPDVKSASPVVNATGVTLVYNGTSYEPGTFVGTTPSYLAAHGYHLQEGTAFTEADVAHHARVAVIGQTVVEELFPGQDPIGQTMRANGVNFEVIGVLAAKGSNGVSNLDEIVAAPITTVQDSLSGYGPIDSITVEATSESALGSAEAEVTQILEQRHKVKDTAEPGFEVINQGSLLETTSSTTSVFTTLARRGRGDLAAGGRHRRDEHHAGVRHRAHPRDRHSQGRRRTPLGHPHAVPHRGRAGVADRRPHRGAARGGGQPVRNCRRAPRDRHLLDLPRLRRRRAHRPLLRHLPGGARRASATDRGTAL